MSGNMGVREYECHLLKWVLVVPPGHFVHPLYTVVGIGYLSGSDHILSLTSACMKS